MKPLYYEIHVTVEPLFDARLENFKRVAKIHGFNVADLLMKKSRNETEQRSDKDSFCTGHTIDYSQAAMKVRSIVEHLKKENIKVWRAKIESVVMDTRIEDTMRLHVGRE